jgi:hypothetical protein
MDSNQFKGKKEIVASCAKQRSGRQNAVETAAKQMAIAIAEPSFKNFQPYHSPQWPGYKLVSPATCPDAASDMSLQLIYNTEKWTVAPLAQGSISTCKRFPASTTS